MESRPEKEHIIRIFRTNNQPPRVDVGNALVRPGDTVVFDAREGEYTLLFPEAGLFKGIDELSALHVSEKKPSGPHLVVGNIADMEYEYYIFCKKVRRSVVVNSPPKMIIDR